MDRHHGSCRQRSLRHQDRNADRHLDQCRQRSLRLRVRNADRRRGRYLPPQNLWCRRWRWTSYPCSLLTRLHQHRCSHPHHRLILHPCLLRRLRPSNMKTMRMTTGRSAPVGLLAVLSTPVGHLRQIRRHLESHRITTLPCPSALITTSKRRSTFVQAPHITLARLI